MSADPVPDVDDVSTLIPYYEKTPTVIGAPAIGQVAFTPVMYLEHRPKVADPVRSDPFTHTQADVTIRPMDDKSDFRPKRRLPIKALNLGETEELIVSRAKQRPCLILAATSAININSLPAGRQRNQALNAFPRSYCLAPIMSVGTAEKPTAFGPVMTARIKCMMYPEFIFAPQSGMVLTIPGIVRLDGLFWSHLKVCTELQALSVTNEVLGLCWNQLRILAGEKPSAEYSELRELLLAFLPADCK